MELHGAQRLTTDDGMPVTGRPELSTYYHPDSPIAEAIDAVQDKKKGRIHARGYWSWCRLDCLSYEARRPS